MAKKKKVQKKIGNLGNLITFRVSDKQVLTFQDFKQTVSGRWATHERIGKKPQSEFLGAELRRVTFQIELFAQKEIRPRKIIKEIEQAIETGKAMKLVIGGKPIGRHKWKIINMSEVWDVLMLGGKLYQATISLTLEEYV